MHSLGDLMGRQRELLDKTFREQQGNGDPKDGGGKGLAQQEGKLRDDLSKVLKGLEGAPTILEQSGPQHGRGARRAGREGFRRCGQRRATGARCAAPGRGRHGEGYDGASAAKQGTSGNEDPLGRAQGAFGTGTGGGVKIPDEAELAARALDPEELRKRAAERGRPKEELDYIDRLLKEF